MNDSTDLEVRYAVNPATGERMELDAPSEDLAQQLDEVHDMEAALRFYKRKLQDELLERMDKAAAWSMKAGEYEISGRSPEPSTEYDGNALALLLAKAVDDGEISKEAAQAAVEEEVTYKPRKRGINALLKVGGELAERIKATGQQVEKTRYANVRRLRP